MSGTIPVPPASQHRQHPLPLLLGKGRARLKCPFGCLPVSLDQWWCRLLVQVPQEADTKVRLNVHGFD